jgi:Holliday junction resolvase RusA-like endonuclease
MQKKQIFIIQGSIPSKKNSRVNCRNGRSFPSANHRKWLKCALQSTIVEYRYESLSNLEIVLYSKDKRKFDIDNKTSTILDFLVSAKIVPDDNCYIIPKITIRFGGVDKQFPRAEVTMEGKVL